MNVLITIGIRTLEVLFFGGCIGSFIVVVIAGIEDVATALERGESDSGATAGSEPSSE